MQATTPNVELEDRTLWFDGDSTVSEDYLMGTVAGGHSVNGLCIEVMTPAIEQYNKFVSADQQIKVKTEVAEHTIEWMIPDEYKEMDIEKFIAEKFFLELKTSKLTENDQSNRLHRIQEELQLYEKLEFFDILRTIIYVINTLQENNVVWGVGRGSSVASYILYLIGVHDVDSVAYDLDITEFLRIE